MIGSKPLKGGVIITFKSKDKLQMYSSCSSLSSDSEVKLDSANCSNNYRTFYIEDILKSPSNDPDYIHHSNSQDSFPEHHYQQQVNANFDKENKIPTDNGENEQKHENEAKNKRKKAKKIFTNHNIEKILEENYKQTKYPSLHDRMELAAKLDLNDLQVRTWYSNRRIQNRQQEPTGLELLTDSDNYHAVRKIFKTNKNWGNWMKTTLPLQANPLDFQYKRVDSRGIPITNLRHYPSWTSPYELFLKATRFLSSSNSSTFLKQPRTN